MRLALGTVLALGALAGPVAAADVVVFAAASLKSALDQVARDWEASTGNRVQISYAGSGKLAKQILDGAPADIFLSAAPEWMDAVEADGMILPQTRRDLLGNRLVLVGHGRGLAAVEIDRNLDLAALLGGEHLAMAFVDSVPAGQYGKAALEYLGQWAAVAPLVAQSDNVRAALALVDRGEAPLGIVYATDVRAATEVTVIGTFPAESHPPIRYPVALLAGSADPEDAAFLLALSSPEAAAVFRAEGFEFMPAPGVAGP